MNKEELQMLGFEIVAYAGDARSSLLSIIKEARDGKFDNVDTLMADAEENLNLAHKAQTKCLAAEADGQDLEIGFIFVHGQDHLMTTILLKELTENFVDLYKEKYNK